MLFHVAIALALSVQSVAGAPEARPWWDADAANDATGQLREHVLESVDRATLRALHELLAAEPHIAGTEGDRRIIEALASTFENSGLEVEVHEFWPYLARPVDAAVQIRHTTGEGNEKVLTVKAMGLTECTLAEDLYTHDPELPIGFNAYSATGKAQAEVVYANYGTREDFATLRERGIDCTGKIVLARYGGNFRGYKAYYAEQAGATGLIIYTDPKDSGFDRGTPYPEGGWANETYIQRGSILTLPYPGDPLTPFHEATRSADRMDPADLALPTIPVQPIGWGEARRIIELMDGELVPESWRGGLDLPYRFTGGAALRITMDIEQKRDIARTANVIGVLRGASEPDRYVIVGCHHDAWGHGASDPMAGMIVVTELARIFGEAAKQGIRPARTVIFAGWGAEEYGIIGSTEWCEANRDMLASGAVAYINLDMAAMGLRFRSAASPSLRVAIAHAAGLVEHPSLEGRSVLETWLVRGGAERSTPSFGSLGGGSDHVGFYCHLGVPSCSLGGGGSDGVAYHSNYDTIAWYQKVVGDDYDSAHMVTQVCAALIAELASAPVLPIDPRGYADDGLAQLEALEVRAKRLEVEHDVMPLRRAMERYRDTASEFVGAVRDADVELDRDAINAALLRLERAWLAPLGLPDRQWYANLYGASDPYSGYAAWVFPALRLAIEEGDGMEAAVAAAQLIEVYGELEQRVKSMRGEINALE